MLATMGVELDKKHAIIAMRACYRSASRHPVVVVLILFTIWFYRSFPLLLRLLVYASPVIVSTAVLLGTLLLFGHQNASKIRKEGKPHHHEIHNLKIRVIEDTEIGGNDVRSEPRENAFGEKILVVDNVNIIDDHPRSQINSRRSSIDSSFSISMADKMLREEAKSEVSDHNQRIILGGDKVVLVNRSAQFQPSEVNKTESSSLTASLADTLPVVDELPPLLEPDVPHHAHMMHVHKIGSEVPRPYAASNHSLQFDNHGDDEDEEEEANANETEDDQKSLRNLGKPELETHQHLENIIARQKAIKNMRMQAEENLVNINLDISYSVTPNPSTRRNSIDPSTRRNSIDLPYDLNETVLDSVPSVIMPRIINTFDLPYDQSGDKSYPIGPTFQSESLSSFQPNHQFSHNHEGFDLGSTTLGASRQNEGYYTSGVIENVSQRSPSSSSDDDTMKLHLVGRDGRLYEVKEKGTIGTTFKSDSLHFQPNDQFSHLHESSDVGTSTLMEYHTSKVSVYVSQDDDRFDEVKASGGDQQGYQGKSSGESSSSSFSDVSDHLDDEEEEFDYSSAVMPSTPEWQTQEQRKKENQIIQEEGRKVQRGVTSWFGWKQ